MNRQGKIINGKVVGQISWTKTIHPDGTETRGATDNPVGGCLHRCQWAMPDGSIAGCYAKAVAEGVASKAYPAGFEHHYWHPERLMAPLKVKQPMRIFWDSMADLFGHWVPDDQIQAVLDMASEAHWHTFQSLTKNPKRMLRFNFSDNVWVGVSMPPDFMWGKRLNFNQKKTMLHQAFRVLDQLAARGQSVTWMSFEPLSWDVSKIIAQYPVAIRWAVIGAATNGAKVYQPEAEHVRRVLEVLDGQGVPVFFKGNLRGNEAAAVWREEFPGEIITDGG